MVRFRNFSEGGSGSGKNSSGFTTLRYRYLNLVVVKFEEVPPLRARLRGDRAGGKYSAVTDGDPDKDN
jgi:hypothetical protein